VIKTHGKWAITFAATKVAVLFAYPHQAREFSKYKKFIVGQFTDFIDISQHPIIILLDHAIHLQVACSNDLALDHFEKFSDLITHHVIIGVILTMHWQSGPANKKSHPNPFNPDVEVCCGWNAGHCTSET